MNNVKMLNKVTFPSILNQEKQDPIARKNQLIQDLYSAVKNNQLEVYYQPQTNLQTGNLTGVEALLRWNHPELGFISPSEFIPLLEEIGLMNIATEYVLYTACSEMKKYADLSSESFKVSVNLPPEELNNKYLVANIDRILSEIDFPPELLTLEIVESSLIDDLEKAQKVIQQLKDLGISIAIDDFGTGYSSFAYLLEFNVDIVKIDRSFVTDLDKSFKKRALVKGIINTCKSLELQVVAEGIETKRELEILAKNNADYAQGYLISKPLSLDNFQDFFSQNYYQYNRQSA